MEPSVAYDNTQRAAAAGNTRQQVLAAASQLFLNKGFGGTTIREIAEAAGVSQETIYKTYGGKARLLKSVYDVALSGDDEDIPLAERPEALAIRAATTPDEAATAYSQLARVIAGRVDPLLRVLLGSRDADTSLSEFANTTDQERLVGARWNATHWDTLGWLRPGLTIERAAEILWALNSAEPRWLLQDRGWTEDDFADWLAEMIRHAIFA
jgi:AcrR family transcriptional regulator